MWIRRLLDARQPDGTWGRFHTRDSRLKRLYPTTEIAVDTAMDLGLTGRDPELDATVRRIVEYAEGTACWPDNPEKHDNPDFWYVWVRHFSAGVLAALDGNHPALNQYKEFWLQVTRSAFKTGIYDRKNEIDTVNELTGFRMKDPVPFHRRFPLQILAAGSSSLEEPIGSTVLEFLLNLDCGIYYLHNKPAGEMPDFSSGKFWSWLKVQKLLSGFPGWRSRAPDLLNPVWSIRDDEGFWDAGPLSAKRPYTPFPLSDSWRKPINRRIDMTVEVLSLLSRIF